MWRVNGSTTSLGGLQIVSVKELICVNLTFIVSISNKYADLSLGKHILFCILLLCIVFFQTSFGIETDSGSVLQSALPVSVFKCLHSCFGVTFECFASPLNCFFRQYCSAYADTDCYFGSRGWEIKKSLYEIRSTLAFLSLLYKYFLLPKKYCKYWCKIKISIIRHLLFKWFTRTLSKVIIYDKKSMKMYSSKSIIGDADIFIMIFN